MNNFLEKIMSMPPLASKHGADVDRLIYLVHGLMAIAPSLDPSLLESLIRKGIAGQKLELGSPAAISALLGSAEFPGASDVTSDLAALIASDQFRAALGRIGCFYDGGHIVE